MKLSSLICCSWLLISFSKGQVKNSSIHGGSQVCHQSADSDDLPPVVIVKIGGSSITNKASKETLDSEALSWFSRTLQSVVLPEFLSRTTSQQEQNQKEHDSWNASETNCHPTHRRRSFVIIHGAGSFGHHTAKEYGLQGFSRNASSISQGENHHPQQRPQDYDRYTMEGLAKTRLSVQTLNRYVVESLIHVGINAVGISPCFAIHPGYWPGHGDKEEEEELFQSHLATVIQNTLQAGLVPVLHGDACLASNTPLPSSSKQQPQQQRRRRRHQRQQFYAGILSGDTLMQILGQELWVDEAIFLTDVDGVYTSDPKLDHQAELLRSIEVNATDRSIVTGHIATSAAGASSHAHDVTGGLKSKLASAVEIASSGKKVTIVRCKSQSAEQVLRGDTHVDRSTTILAAKSNPRETI